MTQCQMETQCLSFQEFQDDEHRAFPQVQDPTQHGALCNDMGHIPMNLTLLRAQGKGEKSHPKPKWI